MKLIAPFIAIITAFIAPIRGLGLMMIGFILLDTLFAIYVALKTQGIKSFRSGKLFNIVPKLVLYLGGILLAHAFSLYIIQTPVFGIEHLLLKLVSTLFIYIECKSIDESYVKLYKVSLGTYITSMLEKIKVIKKDINDITK